MIWLLIKGRKMAGRAPTNSFMATGDFQKDFFDLNVNSAKCFSRHLPVDCLNESLHGLNNLWKNFFER
jgi:hypothetical protein